MLADPSAAFTKVGGCVECAVQGVGVLNVCCTWERGGCVEYMLSMCFPYMACVLSEGDVRWIGEHVGMGKWKGWAKCVARMDGLC